MVDAGVGARRDLGLGAIGDAKAGGFQHRKIVGAVADGERLGERKALRRGDLLQRAELGVGSEDRLDRLAGEPAGLDHDLVGAVLVGANPLANRARELAEAARHDRDMGAARPHRAGESARSRVERDALPQRVGDDGFRQTGQQFDPLAQSRLEGDLAPRRALGDRSDPVAKSRIGRELVDAFLADQGRIHIRNQEALLPISGRLDDDVDRLAAERVLERGADGLERSGEEEIGGGAVIEPAPRIESADALRKARDMGIGEPRQTGIGDQRGGDGGRRHEAPRARANQVRRALLIAGPTASGKSAAALALAERFGATVVNADSMQVYADLRILTARPTAEQERRAPHRLFGTIDGAVNYSAGRWARAAGEILAEIGDRPVIFVGGTGLYLRALTEGLSEAPPTPEAVRAGIRAEAEGRLSPELHAELQAQDPETAARLNPNDRQRIMRALEVVAATGRPLASFLGARSAPALQPHEWAGLFLAPDRAELYRRIDARFDAMLAEGALDEVARLMKRGLDPALPVMRAHGVRHLFAHLEGRIALAEAAARSKLDTRHYAKRQFTWARQQMTGFRWVAPEDAVDEGARELGGTWV